MRITTGIPASTSTVATTVTPPSAGMLTKAGKPTIEMLASNNDKTAGMTKKVIERDASKGNDCQQGSDVSESKRGQEMEDTPTAGTAL